MPKPVRAVRSCGKEHSQGTKAAAEQSSGTKAAEESSGTNQRNEGIQVRWRRRRERNLDVFNGSTGLFNGSTDLCGLYAQTGFAYQKGGEAKGR
jgi:hypothetical protein